MVEYKKQLSSYKRDRVYPDDGDSDLISIDETRRKEGFKCPHVDKKHYAKKMCHNCYHRKGKTKMASKCEHTNKPHYSNGLCQNCYLAQYYIKRKKKQEEKNALEKAKREEKEKAEKLSCEGEEISINSKK